MVARWPAYLGILFKRMRKDMQMQNADEDVPRSREHTDSVAPADNGPSLALAEIVEERTATGVVSKEASTAELPARLEDLFDAKSDKAVKKKSASKMHGVGDVVSHPNAVSSDSAPVSAADWLGG